VLRLLFLGTLVLGLLSVVSCGPQPLTDSLAPDQSVAPLIVKVADSFGQSFVARHAGLQAISVFLLANESGGDEQFTLHLRDRANSTPTDLRTAQRLTSGKHAAGWYQFDFQPIAESHDRSYYFFIENKSDHPLAAGTLDAAAYHDGALYLNQTPQDSQLAFQVEYGFVDIALDLARWMAQLAFYVIIGALAFVVPGLAIVVYVLPNADSAYSVYERIAIGAGLSLALYPILMLWTNLLGIQLGAWYAWLPALIGIAALSWRYWKHLSQARGVVHSGPSAANLLPRPGLRNLLARAARSELFWPELTVLGVTALILFVRLFVLRSIDIPMWGDSYQHTMIAQLIVDHGGLFDSWEPYAELQSLTYHFGFHADAAVFHWLSGVDVPNAVLVTGQLLNALAVMVLYPLTVRVSGNRWAGVAAVLLAGMFSPMPMFYTNWGRYTQLAGQAILPIAVLLAWNAFDQPSWNWRLPVLAMLAIGGLSLTHFRVLVFFVLFVIAYGVSELWRRERIRARLINIVAVTAGAALIFFPWFAHLVGGSILGNLASQITRSVDSTPTWIQGYNSIDGWLRYLPLMMWLLLPLGLAWGFWHKRQGVVLFVLWGVLLLLSANPQWLRLPGEGAINNFAIFIAAYIPVGILAGSALGWLFGARPLVSRLPYVLALAALALAAGIANLADRTGDISPAQYALVTQPDLRAAAWIQANVSRDARFLVNSFSAYGDSLFVGSDGGWWIPLLAHRQTMLPPITYGVERGPRPDYGEWINSLPVMIRARGIAAPEAIAMLGERGITHVFIGQLRGRVNYDGPDVLAPDRLAADRHFRAIYHEDRVWIFQVNQ
jgi:hypothetical protein